MKWKHHLTSLVRPLLYIVALRGDMAIICIRHPIRKLAQNIYVRLLNAFYTLKGAPITVEFIF